MPKSGLLSPVLIGKDLTALNEAMESFDAKGNVLAAYTHYSLIPI